MQQRMEELSTFTIILVLLQYLIVCLRTVIALPDMVEQSMVATVAQYLFRDQPSYLVLLKDIAAEVDC